MCGCTCSGRPCSRAQRAMRRCTMRGPRRRPSGRRKRRARRRRPRRRARPASAASRRRPAGRPARCGSCGPCRARAPCGRAGRRPADRGRAVRRAAGPTNRSSSMIALSRTPSRSSLRNSSRRAIVSASSVVGRRLRAFGACTSRGRIVLAARPRAAGSGRNSRQAESRRWMLRGASPRRCSRAANIAHVLRVELIPAGDALRVAEFDQRREIARVIAGRVWRKAGARRAGSRGSGRRRPRAPRVMPVAPSTASLTSSPMRTRKSVLMVGRKRSVSLLAIASRPSEARSPSGISTVDPTCAAVAAEQVLALRVADLAAARPGRTRRTSRRSAAPGRRGARRARAGCANRREPGSVRRLSAAPSARRRNPRAAKSRARRRRPRGHARAAGAASAGACAPSMSVVGPPVLDQLVQLVARDGVFFSRSTSTCRSTSETAALPR